MNGALTHGDPTAQVEVEARTLHNDTFVTVPQPTTLSVVEPMAEDKQTEHATPTNCEESAADSFTLPEYPDILYQPLDELAATIGRLELCNTRPRCVECKQRLGFDEVPLRLHLERHKREHEHPNHKCDECGVHFVYIKDLRYHQHTAFTGYCGFPFDHVDECTGHHSSSKTAQSDHRPFVDGVRVQEHWRLQRLIQQLRDVEIKRTIMDPQDGRVLTDRHRWSWAGLRHRVSQSSIGKISIKSDHSGPAAFNTETLQASLDEVAADLNTHAGHAQLTALRNENKRLLSSLKPRKSRLSETQESISENSMTDGLKKSYLSRQMAAAVKPQHFNRALEPFSQGASLKKVAACNDTRAAEALIQYGADPNTSNWAGETATHWAARHGHLDAVQLLVKRHANINIETRIGRTPLCQAVVMGWAPVSRFLIGSGAHVRTDTLPASKRGWTLLHYAAREGQTELVRLLIEKGVNANAESAYKFSRQPSKVRPLHIAATAAVAELLLKNGANLEARTSCGLAPLHYAAAYRRAEVAEVLIRDGADVNVRDTQRRTPSNSPHK
ncbi:Poly [ADP-ribose] polymerase tankyrase-2 [Taxawa tesnikishii (nom. ined.)]|nr:Poly [ADP-ribose] polymerase tankyrase-2 [Dothideales sp. JES 119]